MTAKQVIDELQRLIARCTDSEYDLLEALTDEAEGWNLRIFELDADNDGQDNHTGEDHEY